MKTMNCQQLGGACEKEFSAETFEEIEELSKQHGMEMFKKNDEAHIKAMQEIQKLMKTPDDFQKWKDEKKRLFESL